MPLIRTGNSIQVAMIDTIATEIPPGAIDISNVEAIRNVFAGMIEDAINTIKSMNGTVQDVGQTFWYLNGDGTEFHMITGVSFTTNDERDIYLAALHRTCEQQNACAAGFLSAGIVLRGHDPNDADATQKVFDERLRGGHTLPPGSAEMVVLIVDDYEHTYALSSIVDRDADGTPTFSDITELDAVELVGPYSLLIRKHGQTAPEDAPYGYIPSVETRTPVIVQTDENGRPDFSQPIGLSFKNVD